jgi:hypothetical protein
MELSGGQRLDLLEIFPRDYPKQLSDMRAALRNKDAPFLDEVAHQLKGSVCGVHGLPSFETVARLDRSAIDGDLLRAETALAELEPADRIAEV